MAFKEIYDIKYRMIDIDFQIFFSIFEIQYNRLLLFDGD